MRKSYHMPDYNHTFILQEPKTYVDALLEVHRKYNDLVQTAFSGEAGFVASLDKACREFVNRNKVCKISTSKSPELLARFCDSLLKKSAKNPEENELEDVLNGTVRKKVTSPVIVVQLGC